MRLGRIYAEVIDTAFEGYCILWEGWMGPSVLFSMPCLGTKIF